jgi:hypothetical protein
LIEIRSGHLSDSSPDSCRAALQTAGRNTSGQRFESFSQTTAWAVWTAPRRSSGELRQIAVWRAVWQLSRQLSGALPDSGSEAFPRLPPDLRLSSGRLKTAPSESEGTPPICGERKNCKCSLRAMCLQNLKAAL